MIDFALPISINKDTVMSLKRKVLRISQTSKDELNINCQSVVSIDSAGIALLLALKQHPTLNCRLQNLSTAIHNMCNLYSITL